MKNRIRELRAEKNITQLRLSLELEVSQETVSAYENGKHLPSLKSLIKMADIFHVSTDYLIGRSDVAAQNFCHNFSLFLTQIFGKYFRNLIHETEGFLPSVFLTFKMIITLLFNVGYNDLFFDFYLFLRKGCNLFLKLIDSVTYLLTLFA